MIKKIKYLVVLLIFMFNLFAPIISLATEDIITITFQDENLYNAIKTQLSSKIENNIDSTYTIQMTQDNLDSVTSLSFVADGVTNISGIENFKNLQYLNFWNNYVEDFTPVGELTNLLSLSMDYNTPKIKNISFLSNLINLRVLSIMAGSSNTGSASKDSLEDISALAKLTNLTNLNLAQNNISDIRPLANLNKLTSLNLEGASIEEVSILTNLTNLTSLHLETCQIDDEDLVYISNLTNLKSLYLGNSSYEGNNITNIEPIKKLTNLTTLRLDNNDIIDISALKELVNLEELALRGNNISDLEPISNLTQLTDLSLGRDNYGTGNPISTLQPLRNLTNLLDLEIAMCNITDISPLAGSTKLQTLDLMCNEVTDISPLENLSNLRSLQLWGNKINDIEPLGNLAKLSSLDIGYNEISDMSILEQLNISRLICNSQKITISVEKGEKVKLPNLFLQAKDSNSQIYADREWKFTNCKLSDDGIYIIPDEDIINAKVTIGGERYSSNKTHVVGEGAFYSTLEIVVNDTIPPILDVQYSPKEMTKDTVTVTITANETIQPVEGWTLKDNGKTLSKTYAKNTDEIVKVYDLAGNEAEANIRVNNIDTTVPQAEIEYSTTMLTNQNVLVTITADEEIREVEGWTLSKDNTTLSKEFENNIEEKVTIYDLVGNKREIDITVNNIDKVAPAVGVTYSTKELTNGKVEVTITADEKVQPIEGWTISSDNQKLVKEYENNIENEKIIIYDLVGNSTYSEITITNIDKESPELEIMYSTIEETTDTVTVQIKANEKIKKVEGWILNAEQNILTREFDSNISEEIMIYDLAGNGTIQEVTVDNIVNKTVDNTEDKTVAPTVLPKAGQNTVIIVIITVVILMIVIFGIQVRNFKDIK